MLKIYVVRQNSDLTEGRGRMEIQAYFTSEYAALDFVQQKLQTDMGGDKSAEIVETIVFESLQQYTTMPSDIPMSRVVWGRRKNWIGEWDEGWIDLRDAPDHDPEFFEFQRLLKKFWPYGVREE